jgi:hypothetical protein
MKISRCHDHQGQEAEEQMPQQAHSTPRIRTWRAVLLLPLVLPISSCAGEGILGPGSIAGTVMVEPGDTTLSVGQRLRLEVTVLNTQGSRLTDPQISFSSSDIGVAKVSALGWVTAVGAGNATIEARSQVVTASIGLTVVPAQIAAVQISLSPYTHVGWVESLDVYALDADGKVIADTNAFDHAVITLASDSEQLLIVPRDGWDWLGYAVRAIGEGVGTITAEADGVVATAPVRVYPALLNVDPAEVTIGAGDEMAFAAHVVDRGGSTIPPETLAYYGISVGVEWMSDDESVATVDEEGRVRGVAPGNATIYAGSSGPFGAWFTSAASAVISVN